MQLLISSHLKFIYQLEKWRIVFCVCFIYKREDKTNIWNYHLHAQFLKPLFPPFRMTLGATEVWWINGQHFSKLVLFAQCQAQMASTLILMNCVSSYWCRCCIEYTCTGFAITFRNANFPNFIFKQRMCSWWILKILKIQLYMECLQLPGK